MSRRRKFFGIDLKEEFGRWKDYEEKGKDMVTQAFVEMVQKIEESNQEYSGPGYRQYTRWDQVDIEEKVPTSIVLGDETKTLFTFEEHEKRLKGYGWERALSPREAINILIGDLEGEYFPEHLRPIAKGIRSDSGEFLSHAMYKDGEYLNVFEFVRGLQYNESSHTYIPPEKERWFYAIKSFDIGDTPPGWYDLTELNNISDILFNYLFSLEYEKMPEVIRKGTDKAIVLIPDDKNIWPMKIGDAGPYNISCVRGPAGSRGLKVNR